MRAGTSNLAGAGARVAARGGARWRAVGGVGLALVTLALLGAVVATGRVPARIAYDMGLYHVPAIRTFAEGLPRVDVWDYLSATTPGYHLLLALVERATGGAGDVGGAGGSVTALRGASALFTLGFAALLGWTLVRQRSHARPDDDGAAHLPHALGLGLAVVGSMYVLLPGAYVLPDGAGWLCVLAALSVALSRTWTLGTFVLAGLVMLALIWIRQVHAWALAPLVVGAWLGAGRDVDRAPALPADEVRTRGARVLAMLAACAPALLSLLALVVYWGGLTPPRFAGQYPPLALGDLVLSPAPAFTLALVGLFGVFYAGYWWPVVAGWARERSPVLALLLGAGVVLALLPPTTYDMASGRWTGLWTLAGKLPGVGRTSLLIAGLCVLGTVTLGAMLARARGRDAWVLLAALAGFVLAMTASREVWQRYVDPMALLTLALLASASTQRREDGTAPFARVCALARPALPLLLGALLVLMALASVVRSPVRVSDPPPPAVGPDHDGPPPPVLLERPRRA